MADSWVFRISGAVDRPVLDRLRAELGLSKVGRLADDWDELFGEAEWAIQGKVVRVELWRDVDSQEWRLELESPDPLPEAEKVSLGERVQAGLRLAGLEVASIIKRP
ncbi:hypothetical protein RM555_25945 [Micromonospora sp. DSM 115977]|uniref:CYTH domain-containing protein n=1 Tax=Micromonospora reichwaldensis TaxID=3075516 RepID=A0ABU2X3W7_9ACTN|nr:hypothetical protein [Micromonospora sp. DSM 115977]MDT0532448.1 hypothetical protein [Micromonospora sp. DSM 115977]